MRGGVVFLIFFSLLMNGCSSKVEPVPSPNPSDPVTDDPQSVLPTAPQETQEDPTPKQQPQDVAPSAQKPEPAIASTDCELVYSNESGYEVQIGTEKVELTSDSQNLEARSKDLKALIDSGKCTPSPLRCDFSSQGIVKKDIGLVVPATVDASLDVLNYATLIDHQVCKKESKGECTLSIREEVSLDSNESSEVAGVAFIDESFKTQSAEDKRVDFKKSDDIWFVYHQLTQPEVGYCEAPKEPGVCEIAETATGRFVVFQAHDSEKVTLGYSEETRALAEEYQKVLIRQGLCKAEI